MSTISVTPTAEVKGKVPAASLWTVAPFNSSSYTSLGDTANAVDCKNSKSSADTSNETEVRALANCTRLADASK